MRVTENSNYEAIRASMQRSKERLERLQLQSATQKKVNQPSDNPVGAAKILEIRTERLNDQQFQDNAKLVESFLSETESGLMELSELVIRAKELAMSQANDASANQETRHKVAEEVTQLYRQAISASNRRFGERYLFGGYKMETPPVDSGGKYWGDQGQVMVEIADDVFLSMNIAGDEVFNTQPLSVRFEMDAKEYFENNADSSQKIENVNLFAELESFKISLLTNDPQGIRKTIEHFDSLHNNFLALRARLGSRIQGLQNAAQSIERRSLVQATLNASIEDADMIQVVTDLGREESVYRNALASSKGLIQPTLLDFLK